MKSSVGVFEFRSLGKRGCVPGTIWRKLHFLIPKRPALLSLLNRPALTTEDLPEPLGPVTTTRGFFITSSKSCSTNFSRPKK